MNDDSNISSSLSEAAVRDAYLNRFGYGHNLSIQELWSEMDRIWCDLGLDNHSPLAGQAVGEFYSHPVWILNGLFASIDPESVGHRESIAKYIGDLGQDASLIADFGGGSGVLAKTIAQRSGNVREIDIIEPYPFEYFRALYSDDKKIKYVPEFSHDDYDMVIAQDVLEHVDDPIEIAVDCLSAVRTGGLVVFANCFYPVIMCHLPGTFFLRHTFRYVLSVPGVEFVGTVKGAEHALIFKKTGDVDVPSMRGKERFAKRIGPFLNVLGTAKRGLGDVLRALGLCK
jgi:2-polyprenyl-3-methyl-5-hydroxy-6-metoxy-1,4-benzoquinol methylase